MRKGMLLLLCVIALNIPTICATDFIQSSVTLVGLNLPQGNYKIIVYWGAEVTEETIVSVGDPMNVSVKFPHANLRAPMKMSVLGSSGSMFEVELRPTWAGYRITRLEMRNATELYMIQVSEALSLISIRVNIAGINREEVKGISLTVNGEEASPVIQEAVGGLIVNVPPVIVDPGQKVDVGLVIQEPWACVNGTLVLIGDRLIAGGSCDGSLAGATMAIEHIYGLATINIPVPSSGPAVQQEISRSLTEISIRRGLPPSHEGKLVVIVKDQEGKPIADAEIEFTSTNKSGKVVSDERGMAIIDVFGPTVELKISKPGYQEVLKRVDMLSSFMKTEVTLKKYRGLLDTIVEALQVLKGYFTVILVLGALALLIGLVKAKGAFMAVGIGLIALSIFLAFML